MLATTASRSALFLRDLNHEPIEIVRGSGVHLYDTHGRRYLDAASGAAVASLGHGNAEIAATLAEQAQRLAFAHPSKFVTPWARELADKLVARAPEGLTRVLLTSGGSESTETAVKLARQYHLAHGKPTKYKVVSRRTSYHGATLGALTWSGQVARREPFAPMLMGQPQISAPDHYRGSQAPVEEFEAEKALELEAAILAEGPENVAAFIAEPISGSSIPGLAPGAGYWRAIRETCDRYDVVFIADEVMSGNGRSGRWWAMQHAGVAPDMIATAKGIGAGYTPLGAVLVQERFEEQLRGFPGNFRHGHTYAGNPLSCAVGSKVIDLIEAGDLLANVRARGEQLKRRLEEELGGHPNVGTVRGRGLLLGVEFVADAATKEPFPPELDVRGRFSRACLVRGVYTYQGGGSVDGRRGDHTLLAPPFIITAEQVEELVSCMAEALRDVVRELEA